MSCGEPFGRERQARRVDPPDPKVVPRHMTEPQWEAFWAELTCDRDRAMAMMSVDSGIRPGELLGLRGEDLDWGNALVHVVRKGGRRAQWVPVSRAAVVWLRRYQAASGYVAEAADPVWVTTRGKQRRVTYDAWRAAFMRVNRQLGTNWTRMTCGIRRVCGCWTRAWPCTRSRRSWATSISRRPSVTCGLGLTS